MLISSANSAFAAFYYSGEKYEVYIKNSHYGVRTVPTNDTEKTKVIIPPFFDDLEYDYDGRLIAKRFGKYGVIDITGIVIVPLKWDSIFEFDNKSYKVKQNSKYGLVSINGEMLTDVIYDHITYLDSYKAVYQRNNHYGFLGSNYKEITEPMFLDYVNLSSYYIGVSDEVGWGVINYLGQEIIPMVNDWMPIRHSSLTSGYILVQKNGSYGLVGIDGTVVLDTKYPLISKLYDYGVEVKVKSGGDNLFGIVDPKTGKYIVQMIYDKVQYWDEYGYYKVKKNGKWGAINSQGKVVYLCKYGPLEINRMVKKLPVDINGLQSAKQNSYQRMFFQAKYYLEVNYKNSAKNFLKKLYESNDMYWKEKAEEIMYEYNYDPYFEQ